MRTLFICLAAVLLVYAPARAQSVGGRVLDVQSRAGVPGVRVILTRPNGNRIAETVSDREGRFTVRAKNSGMHRLQTEHIGYRAVTTDSFDIGGQEQVLVDITLTTAAVQLDPLTIVARQRDPRHDATEDGLFARRETTPHIGTSRVIMPHDAEMMNALDARDVLTWVMPRPGCSVIYWNGHLVRDSTTANLRLQEPVEHLEAVEFYRNQQDAPISFREVPPYLMETVFCHVVALWSRTGRFRTVAPAPALPDYHGYANIAAALSVVSGPQSPGVGAGVEAATHIPVRGSFGIGLHLRVTLHQLSAETTDELTTGLGRLTYVLPPGARGMKVIVAGIEPRFAVMERGSTRGTLGLRMQIAQRRFSLERLEIASSPIAVTSLGLAVGPTASFETQLNHRFAVNMSIAYDRMMFGEYAQLKRPEVDTSADWNAVTLRLGLLFNPPWARVP